MSNDNIDYAELDKAVNEAMQAQPAKPTTRPVVRPTTHSAVKTVARRPATRPQNHGRIMDFAPRSNNKRVITQPLPVKKVVAKPAVNPRPAARPTIPQRPITKPSAHVTQPTTSRESIAAKIQQKRERIVETTPKEAPKLQTKTVPRKVEAPDANSYSLGGRSPFLTDTKVEKRPLGSNIPETNASSIHSTKNVYSSKSPTKAPAAKRKKHTVTEAPRTHSGWLWTLIVILVIAAGAGLGYLAYLIVFANQL